MPPRGQLMLTLPAGTSTWRADDGTGAVILGEDGDAVYFGGMHPGKIQIFDMEIYQDPQRIVGPHPMGGGLTPMTVTRDAQVRYRGGPKSEILTQVFRGRHGGVFWRIWTDGPGYPLPTAMWDTCRAKI